ncbi:MAG: hypothetical protein NWF03_06600 [Candidatus Bathyarchaeota archaeon]|nr:hypothetical protein [Candidatus Bathyarchaeota archaeon]
MAQVITKQIHSSLRSGQKVKTTTFEIVGKAPFVSDIKKVK